MTNANTDMLLDLSRMQRAVIGRIAARQTGETPRGRCYVEQRTFGGATKWLPMVDGAPAEGGESENHCCDFMGDALEIAVRISKLGRLT